MKVRISKYLDDYTWTTTRKIRSKKKRHLKKLHRGCKRNHTPTYYEFFGDIYMGPLSWAKLVEEARKYERTMHVR